MCAQGAEAYRGSVQGAKGGPFHCVYLPPTPTQIIRAAVLINDYATVAASLEVAAVLVQSKKGACALHVCCVVCMHLRMCLHGHEGRVGSMPMHALWPKCAQAQLPPSLSPIA